MRRSAWIFLAAILLPSLVLAWMAVRSARDQQVILEHQQAIICQDITDALAKEIQDQVDSSRLAFVQATDQLLRQSSSPQTLATKFNQQLHRGWNLAEVGFAVDLRGTIYSPSPREDTVARTFRNENERFLSNRENVEVFAQAPAKSKSLKVGKVGSLESNASDMNQGAQPSQAAQQAVQSALQIENRNADEQRGLTANQTVPVPNSNQPLTRNQAQPPQRQRAEQNTDKNLAANAVVKKETENQAAQVQKSGAASQESNQSEVSDNRALSQTGNQAAQQALPQSTLSKKNEPPPKVPPDSFPNQAVQVQRQVEPQSNFGQGILSNTLPEESDFRKVIGSETSGALARFLEDKLRLMVWY